MKFPVPDAINPSSNPRDAERFQDGLTLYFKDESVPEPGPKSK